MEQDRKRPTAVEWPTVGVAVACWTSWVVVLSLHDRMPWPLVLVCLGLAGGWYMSLQHEIIHGHPTPWPMVNAAIGAPPLSMWFPLPVYRETHLRHHEVELTRAGVDPESFYVSAEEWDAASPARRTVLWCTRTLVGRLVLGPVLAIPSVVIAEVQRSRSAGTLVRVWLTHLACVVVVCWVVFGVAGLPVWQYLVGYCWFGLSVSHLRSFAEHLAVPEPATRSAVVRSNWFFGLLFLNNNLHHTHHAMPGAPWYRLPRLTRECGSEALAEQGAGLYRGYGEVFRRYAVRPFSTPVSPLDEHVGAS